MKATITGLDQAVANLRALPAALAGKNGGPVRQALYACAKLLRDQARQLAPYNEEGVGAHLRDEIIMKRDPNPRAVDNAVERYIVTVKYKAKKYANNRANRRKGNIGKTYQNFGPFHYWMFVEFGTSKMEPRSFLGKSFEENKGALPGIALNALTTGIAKIVAGMSK